jgi:ABC-type lipoprotein release transport system permease subunit
MFDSATRKALVIGVLSGAILTYLVEPLFKFFPSMILRVAGAISEGWADTIFRDAAQPEPTESLSVVMMLLLLVMVLAILLPSRRRTPETPNPGVGTAAQRKNVELAVILCFSIFIAFSLFFFVLVRGASSGVERCFRYRLAVLSPHLSERETKELAANWTLMRRRADFDAINGRLREYAGKYNVVPVIKSFEKNLPQWRCI